MAPELDRHADAHRWPLQLRQFDYGWEVTLFDKQGRVRHTASVDTEIQAYRAAFRVAHIYRYQGTVLVIDHHGCTEHDLERLMQGSHPRK